MRAVWSYVAFKGYWSGLEAMILSPIIAFIAIAQDHPGRDSASAGLRYTPANTDSEMADLDGVGSDGGDDTTHEHAGTDTNAGMTGHMIETTVGDFAPRPNQFSSSLGPSYIVT
jgi:hypothetical protein